MVAQFSGHEYRLWVSHPKHTSLLMPCGGVIFEEPVFHVLSLDSPCLLEIIGQFFYFLLRLGKVEEVGSFELTNEKAQI